jgi:hypothetical protein
MKQIKKYRILNAIVFSGNNGISHSELAAKIKVDRKNLRKYVSELITQGLIWRGTGKQGRYYATGNIHKDINASSWLFGTLIEDIIRTKNLVLIDCYGGDNSCHGQVIKLNLNNFATLERMLFEFSNKIGAIVSYTIIQAIARREELMTPARFRRPKNTMAVYTNNEVVEFYQDWVEQALQYAFRKVVQEFMEVILLAAQEMEGPTYAGLYVSGLNNVFAEIYPKIYSEISKITFDFPKAIQSYTMHQEFDAKRKQIQMKCKHTMDPFLGQITRNVLLRQRHCFKCHKNIE